VIALLFATSPALGAEAKLTLAAGPTEDEQKRALEHGQDGTNETEVGEVGEQVTPGTTRGGAGGALRGTFGRVMSEGIDPGWFGRVEIEGFSTAAYQDAGPVLGALIGGEFWTAEEGSGGGMPMSFYFGFRTPNFFSSVGFGADFFIVDNVNDDGGFGIYAPFGALTLGLEVASFRILADARAIYRWQWGAPDRGQVQLGLTFVQFFESPIKNRPRRAPARKASKGASATRTW
jgi:hypothetical protein